MLIVIIVATILIISIILTTIAYRNDRDCFGGIMITAISVCIALGCMICILCTQISAEHHYQKTLYKKEVIEYRIENQNNNIVGNELLYNDIVEFNNSLRETKLYAGNPWTNWFYNAKIASIDYIEIPGLGG